MPSSTGLVVQLRKFRDYQFMLKSATTTTPHVLFMRTIVCIVRIWMWHKSEVDRALVDSRQHWRHLFLCTTSSETCSVLDNNWKMSKIQRRTFMFPIQVRLIRSTCHSNISRVCLDNVCLSIVSFVTSRTFALWSTSPNCSPTCCNHRVDFE